MPIIYLYKNRHTLVRICCGQLINTPLSTCAIIIVLSDYPLLRFSSMPRCTIIVIDERFRLAVKIKSKRTLDDYTSQ